jgi:hypothetical protein
MKHIAWMLVSLLLLPLCAHAGLPADYAPQSLDRAIAQSARDGKPVMLYFTEDW